MNILVTGGAGYIGSHAVRHYLDAGHDVWVYDNLSTGHAQSVPKDRLVVGDLSEADKLEMVLADKQIEAVVHYAAHCYVGESVSDPQKYYHNNLINTLTLLQCMMRRDVLKFVFSSTCATYGNPELVPITETEKQQPINPYGRAKLAVEWVLEDYAHAYGLGYAALRYFNASGASPSWEIGEDHDPETHLIPLILQVALGQRLQIEVFGTDYPTPDGTCIRDYIHVDDLATAHLAAMQQMEPGKGLCLNLGTGKGYSVREVIKTCEGVTGKSIKIVEVPRRPGDPPELVACADKARLELDWDPKYKELGPIIETAWRWHNAHPQGFLD